ncbi:MAG: alpha/beta fold hydrolase [Proteobacteria bacterium]|nr:alpha/beta fold hydrolase [Pseudomonadota bacterium]
MDTPAWGSIEVAWRQAGSGPPLLLVHGLMTSSYSWRYVLEPLGEHFTLYAPDLPGSGASAMPAGPYDPGTLAAWIGQFQSMLGIRGCPVIGNSLGGYLSMRLALDDPGSMARLLNLHSPGVPELRLKALRPTSCWATCSRWTRRGCWPTAGSCRRRSRPGSRIATPTSTRSTPST